MENARKQEQRKTIRKLRNRGHFIILMGLTGLMFYTFNVFDAREHWLIILSGTVFCIYASGKMYYLANKVKKME